MKVDSVNKTLTLDGGQVFHLRPVSSMMLMRIQREIDASKPVVPIVEIEIGGEHVHKEENPNDPDYRKALADWIVFQSQRLMQYTFVMGIADDPPPQDYARIREFFPNATDLEIKYFWIVELLGDDPAVWDLVLQVAIGQTEPTQKGIDESLESFRGDGGSDSSSQDGFEAWPNSNILQPQV